MELFNFFPTIEQISMKDLVKFILLLSLIITYCIFIFTTINFLKKQKKKYDNDAVSTKNSLTLSYKKNNKGYQELSSSFILKQDTLNEIAQKRSDDNFLKKVSLFLTIIMAIIAALLIVAGVILCFIYENKSMWLITTSGVCIQFIACLSFWLLNKAIKEVNQNSLALEKIKDQLTALELIERIDDKALKDKTYSEIIKNLVK